jgi:hypothetical protein
MSDDKIIEKDSELAQPDENDGSQAEAPKQDDGGEDAVANPLPPPTVEGTKITKDEDLK